MIGALLLALIAPLEPLPLIAFIVVLGSRRGRTSALGFIGGWIVAAIAIVVTTWAAAGAAPSREGGNPIAWVGTLQVALGLGLLVLGAGRRTAGATDGTPPRWLAGIDHLGLAGAAVLGALIQPWGLLAAADVGVLRSFDSIPARTAGVIGVTLTCAAPFAIAALMALLHPEETTRRLDAVRRWIESHQRRVVNAIIWIVAAWLIVHGLAVGLAAQ